MTLRYICDAHMFLVTLDSEHNRIIVNQLIVFWVAPFLRTKVRKKERDREFFYSTVILLF